MFNYFKQKLTKKQSKITTLHRKKMSKSRGKRMQEQDFTSSKKIKLTSKKENTVVDFDAINKLILKTHPNLDTKNLELIKFLTIFDILYEKINKPAESEVTEQELDSVDGVPEIIKIICKTLLEILTESLSELKLPVNLKKILIKSRKVLKI